ncbi:type I restriction-modification system subunit M [Aequorivita xiaoshiensis]|uniref:site-specific DNA-methyltransferase (adenine-specific) n=1 Tax=Aequorivita xiaoshiensis TaxID=2874476 RepID=A0A9X1U548_9FLAO|nr:class I SAM-dependent DNA methyltransferase [Aequorivita xiaoshiensis]MCG2431625.1 type I restriction-modification system subunit M [Aequorivita xiaoshiensis]
MNQTQHNAIVNFIWSIADDVLRDVYTRGKYRDIILPFTVLRRLDAILEPTKDKVLEMHQKLNEMKIDNQSPQLRKTSGYVFYNTSNYTFKRLLNEPGNIRQNLETYLDGFSSNVQDIISKFKLRNQLETLEEGNITFPLIEKFCSSTINVSPNPVTDKDGIVVMEGLTNLGMGYVFEELIRKFNEENNEEAGEHFTPREIIKLMTHLIFEPLKGKIKDGTYLIYDPACGSGGMLTEAEHFAKNLNPKATFHLYGQEVNPETYAICKADMLIKDEDPEKIAFGSTLSKDGFPNLQFDFMISNPPYGKTWKVDKDAILDKKEIIDPRFTVGVPRINDGQLLFVMNIVSKLKKNSPLGSRAATIHNGSALFTGDAGQGETEIRKYLLENDLLEAIIALPNDLFYNTGIPTYIFILNNKKDENRKGKLQLISVTTEQFYSKMRKPLGKKRVEFTAAHIRTITDLFLNFENNENSIILDNEDFGYSQITVHRPQRDENGNIIRDSKKKPKSDTALKDKENIPLKEDIDAFFEKEVLPFAEDAWYNPKETKIGYEINFAKYFYKHKAPRALEQISADIFKIEEETEHLLKEIVEA